MFGFNSVLSIILKNNKSYERFSSPYDKKERVVTKSASSKLEKSKESLEKLKEKLEKEQEELRQTLEQYLQDQEDMYRYYEDNFVYDIPTINFNRSFLATTNDYKNGFRYDNVKGSFNSSVVDFGKNGNSVGFDNLSDKGLKYSSANGKRFAKDMAENSVGFTHRCSKYVRQSLQRTGLYNGHVGHAYQMGDVLAKNSNFQEVKLSGIDLKSLPAGCILVYNRGAAGYSSESGHIEVSLGDGTACSDGRTYNVRKSDDMRIFVPVEKA